MYDYPDSSWADTDDDLRDYAEEEFNRRYCDHCGTQHDDGEHLPDADDEA